MTIPSYEKINYDLRPAKQVQRRMIIDTLLKLSTVGFKISDYFYVGMGSIYFVDFSLFHRLIGINKMLCSEKLSEITKRMKFNKPFDHVQIEMKPIGEIIPDLDSNHQYILWLDYDFKLNSVILEDTIAGAQRLTPGSIFLITVDVDENDDTKKLYEKYKKDIDQYFFDGIKVNSFSPDNFPETIFNILQNAINRGINGRNDIEYTPMFKFLYKDGHQMLTIGGIVHSQETKKQFDLCDLSTYPFIVQNNKQSIYKIKIPMLTRKERLFLDSHMPCPLNWKPNEFELSKEDISSYREIYRYYPLYAELLF